MLTDQRQSSGKASASRAKFKSMVKKIFKLSGMHCTSCAMVIEGELEDLGAGARCNWARQEVEVQWDPAQIEEQKLVEAIEKQGYKVITN